MLLTTLPSLALLAAATSSFAAAAPGQPGQSADLTPSSSSADDLCRHPSTGLQRRGCFGSPKDQLKKRIREALTKARRAEFGYAADMDHGFMGEGLMHPDLTHHHFLGLSDRHDRRVKRQIYWSERAESLIHQYEKEFNEAYSSNDA